MAPGECRAGRARWPGTDGLWWPRTGSDGRTGRRPGDGQAGAVLSVRLSLLSAASCGRCISASSPPPPPGSPGAAPAGTGTERSRASPGCCHRVPVGWLRFSSRPPLPVPVQLRDPQAQAGLITATPGPAPSCGAPPDPPTPLNPSLPRAPPAPSRWPRHRRPVTGCYDSRCFCPKRGDGLGSLPRCTCCDHIF